MTVLPNDGFDMCCGNRPQVTHGQAVAGLEYCAMCCICGDSRWADSPALTMVRWNLAQREKAGEGEA
jgi:hypothetical protein